MNAQETKTEQRSEETEFAEREVELAEKFGVEPKTVRLLRQVVDALEYSADKGEDALVKLLAKRFNLTIEKVRNLGSLTSALLEHMLKDQADKKPQPEVAENTTGIPGLDMMIVNAPYCTATAIYAGIELSRSSPELGARIQDFVHGLMPEFFENPQPQRTGIEGGENLDMECDVLPAVQWLRFLDGYKAAMLSETDLPYDEKSKKAESDATEAGQESIGDPNLRTIKRWLKQRTHREKLAAILMLELLQKEGEFNKPDDNAGNDLIALWRTEIIDASGDPEYLNNADPDEAAVTAAVAMMIPWKA